MYKSTMIFKNVTGKKVECEIFFPSNKKSNSDNKNNVEIDNCGVPQGYQGMVDGGDNIKEASWESVSSMLQVVSATQLSHGRNLRRKCVLLTFGHAGRHGDRQRPLQSLPHPRGPSGGGPQLGAEEHHQPLCHRWRRKPDRGQSLPRGVERSSGRATAEG